MAKDKFQHHRPDGGIVLVLHHFPEKLREELKIMAVRHKTTMRELVIAALRAAVKEEKPF